MTVLNHWERHAGERVVTIGNRTMRDVEVVVPPETIDRIKHGATCIACLEPLNDTWPEHCPNWWCNYPIRKEQADAFLRNIKKLQPVTDEELAP